MSVNSEFLVKIQRRQEERKVSFENLASANVLDNAAKQIVELDTVDLIQQLQSRKLTATQVLRAYIAKALELTGRVNCVTEFIPQAFEWASKLDGLNTVAGPLHGLPIAVKEDHDVEGMDTTMGFAKLLYKPAKENSTLVKILLKLGAVPFCKVNLPQSIFSYASENPIYGQTLNSINEKMGPGGSSSGSGSIVAGNGAPIAIGSDLGGSVRIPAFFHGLCSLRPTIRRLTEKGALQCTPEIDAQRGVPGFIAKNAKALSLVWRAILGNNIQNEFDPMTVPIPWNETLFSSKTQLKIGYYTSLAYFPAFLDVQKTVLNAKLALESAGHQVIPFEMPETYNYMKINFDLFTADRYSYLTKMFEGEPVSPCLTGLVESFRNPEKVWKTDEKHTKREIVSSVARRLAEEKPKSADDLWNIIMDKRAFTLDMLERMDKAGIDLILGPCFPFPAIKLEEAAAFLDAIVYTMIWNFVDFPAGVVRFGTETGANVDSYDDEGEPLLIRAKQVIRESVGMPINIQFSARPFKEELVLRALLEMENLRDTK
ncbi:Fatty acid amide hydrolase 1 [Orchesella cincta]|uniref:Fatty acid amide hydrolase 1 n=1 Tax=Orchesella cincta TaxID=48709 RepID=A0A1D2MBC5_ORCCI|nr:Fatty acid amide hydrolase 1 [Orchesella cincta]